MDIIQKPDGQTYTLDFLLTVETLNHQLIRQDKFDKSPMGGPSFFADIKYLHLRLATLTGKGHSFMIDLVDGHGEVDGRIIYPPKSPCLSGATRNTWASR